ncbi:MAG: HlyD family type I secretion periplasmic adaptor subunit [Vitreoscilla sp.]|jgi:hemolysin D|nr:HlyD family type I secretion periplasmic adaptor subunit [Vitreoscilla sp.]
MSQTPAVWKRWNDPLQLIQQDEPTRVGRLVLWVVCVLSLLLLVWSAFGKLDIVATAEGKLVPDSLVKVVQPAEAGVVKALLVREGDTVTEGQVLVRLEPTMANADQAGVTSDLALQLMQERRIRSELTGAPLQAQPGDDPLVFGHVLSQMAANRKAHRDAVEQEQSVLARNRSELESAQAQLQRMQQALPSYLQVAKAYEEMGAQQHVPQITAMEKSREAMEKQKERDAQAATVRALESAVAAQAKRIDQLRSAYGSELQKELVDTRGKVQLLRPNLSKSTYRQSLTELRAPQTGKVKDIATTTLGAVVQPGGVLMTIVPLNERLYADVLIKNEDVGFSRVGQAAQVKVLSFPFQKYGLLQGTVVHISPDASEPTPAKPGADGKPAGGLDGAPAMNANFKARIELATTTLRGPEGDARTIASGMQVVAEINQGRRTVLEYLLSPVTKATHEAGRER